jgi:hypothetical protein
MSHARRSMMRPWFLRLPFSAHWLMLLADSAKGCSLHKIR